MCVYIFENITLQNNRLILNFKFAFVFLFQVSVSEVVIHQSVQLRRELICFKYSYFKLYSTHLSSSNGPIHRGTNDQCSCLQKSLYLLQIAYIIIPISLNLIYDEKKIDFIRDNIPTNKNFQVQIPILDCVALGVPVMYGLHWYGSIVRSLNLQVLMPKCLLCLNQEMYPDSADPSQF